MNPQIATLDKLYEEGWTIKNVYGDGILRCGKWFGDEEHGRAVGVFVREQGTVSPPHVYETQIAQAELAEMGLTIRFGKE